MKNVAVVLEERDPDLQGVWPFTRQLPTGRAENRKTASKITPPPPPDPYDRTKRGAGTQNDTNGCHAQITNHCLLAPCARAQFTDCHPRTCCMGLHRVLAWDQFTRSDNVGRRASAHVPAPRIQPQRVKQPVTSEYQSRSQITDHRSQITGHRSQHPVPARVVIGVWT